MTRLSLDSYREAADRPVAWVTSHIGNDGTLGADNQDVTCYYKLPYRSWRRGENR
jgi:hypothetical protein